MIEDKATESSARRFTASIVSGSACVA